MPRPGATLAYRYDLRDCWDHTVLLEKVLPPDPGARPACVGGRGDAPVEDWNHDEPLPFRPAEIDARLAELHAPEGSPR